MTSAELDDTLTVLSIGLSILFSRSVAGDDFVKFSKAQKGSSFA